MMVGAYEVDITPPPGQSMGGYGNELGSVAKGWWTRLFAKAYYVKDSKGNFFILVSCDLWSISKGLTDKVMTPISFNE